ncbi:MAG: hypothetical protein KDA68_24125, partial [Planctomycetaceae bacterium]|nr:hypothetical protein [Planctomycetaceae bacterium]
MNRGSIMSSGNRRRKNEHTSIVCRRDLLKVGPLALSGSLLPSWLMGREANPGNESRELPGARAKS